MRAPYLALHLTNTLLLLAALTLTAHLLSRDAGFLRGRVRMVAPVRGHRVCGCRLLVVGVTGSLAALGDTLFPASSLSAALRAGFLLDQRLAGALALDTSHRCFPRQHFSHLAAGPRRAQRSSHWDNRSLSALVLILLAAQYVLGILDVALLAPVWLQVRTCSARTCSGRHSSCLPRA